MIDGPIINAINKGAEVIEDLLAFQIAANDVLLRAGREILELDLMNFHDRGSGQWERPSILAEIEALTGETIEDE